MTVMCKWMSLPASCTCLMQCVIKHWDPVLPGFYPTSPHYCWPSLFYQTTTHCYSMCLSMSSVCSPLWSVNLQDPETIPSQSSQQSAFPTLPQQCETTHSRSWSCPFNLREFESLFRIIIIIVNKCQKSQILQFCTVTSHMSLIETDFVELA